MSFFDVQNYFEMERNLIIIVFFDRETQRSNDDDNKVNVITC